MTTFRLVWMLFKETRRCLRMMRDPRMVAELDAQVPMQLSGEIERLRSFAGAVRVEFGKEDPGDIGAAAQHMDAAADALDRVLEERVAA